MKSRIIRTISLGMLTSLLTLSLIGCGLTTPSKDWPVPNESSYLLPEDTMHLERGKTSLTLPKIAKNNQNIMVGEVIKKEVTGDEIFGIVTKYTFSVIGVLKGEHKPHDKVIIREIGTGDPGWLHEKQILLIFSYSPADFEKEKELKENFGKEEAAEVFGQYALTHINDFTTLTTEPFSSSTVDNVSFSRVFLAKQDKLPNEVTLGQIKKLVK